MCLTDITINTEILSKEVKQQVINDVIAYSKKNWVWLAQALQENFVKYYKENQSINKCKLCSLSLTYKLFDTIVMVRLFMDIGIVLQKDFPSQLLYELGGITPTTAWDGTSYTTNTQPLNNFITNLETNILLHLMMNLRFKDKKLMMLNSSKWLSLKCMR